MRPTVAVLTPVAQAKVELKTWITGAEAEYIEAPILHSINEARARADSAPVAGVPEQAIHVANHREIEVFCASILLPGKTTGAAEPVTEPKRCVEIVLHELSDVDYAFLREKIGEIRRDAKKKAAVSNTSGPIASAG